MGEARTVFWMLELVSEIAPAHILYSRLTQKSENVVLYLEFWLLSSNEMN